MNRDTAGGAILRLSQGSYATAILARGAVNRFLAMDLDGFFDGVRLAFFKADEDAEIQIDGRHIAFDIAGAPPGAGVGGNLRAEMACLRRLAHEIRRAGVALIQANDPYISGLNALLLSRITGRPYVLEVVSDYDLSYRVAGKRCMPYLPHRNWEKRVERLVFRSAAAITADRRYYADYALRNGARAARIGRLRCVTDAFYYTATPERPLEEYLPVRGRRVLLVIGRLSAEKYPLDCVEALAGVRRAGQEAVLVFAGEGDLRSAVEERARELRVGDAVHLLGNRRPQELVDLMAGADVIVAPHAGYSLIESALSGTPVVAYDHEWHGELISHERTGLLAPYRDTHALAAAVVRLLENPTLAASLGSQARRKVLRDHLPQDQQEDERAVYRRVLCGK